MPVFIALEFEPSLITKCECDCEGLCVDCKDETKFLLSINPDFRMRVGGVIRVIEIRYGCKTPIRLYVQGHFVPEHTDISVLEDQLVVVKGSKIKLQNNRHGGEAAAAGMTDESASASVSLPTEIQIRNPERMETNPADQIQKGSFRTTITDSKVDIRFLEFVAKMKSNHAVYPVTGKKYHWVRKASHRHRDLAIGHVIKFKADAKTDRLALMQAKHPTLKSEGNSLDCILVIGHWCESSGTVMGPAIIADAAGTILKKYDGDRSFKKPKVLWILMED